MTKKALVVDDNFYNRDLATLALKYAGYEVKEAVDGQDALTTLGREDGFDLVILDLAMPEMNGVTVLQKIRQEPKYDKMRVIVMTANPHMTTYEVDSMADFTMFKPIDVVEFARLVQRL